MHCEEMVHNLPAVADGSAQLRRHQRRHVDRCLRCQADLAQYRKLLRSLRSLRAEVVRPAPGVLADILAGLEGASVDPERAIRTVLSAKRVAYIGGIAAATAAGAVSAIVLTTRTRRTRLAG
ncbi:MAG: hypothetical protein ACRD2C_00330 [Acidimicrobiales bacterium]